MARSRGQAISPPPFPALASSSQPSEPRDASRLLYPSTPSQAPQVRRHTAPSMASARNSKKPGRQLYRITGSHNLLVLARDLRVRTSSLRGHRCRARSRHLGSSLRALRQHRLETCRRARAARHDPVSRLVRAALRSQLPHGHLGRLRDHTHELAQDSGIGTTIYLRKTERLSVLRRLAMLVRPARAPYLLSPNHCARHRDSAALAVKM